MKKGFLELLKGIIVCICLCGSMTVGVFAENEPTINEQEIFLELLLKAEDEHSIMNLIDENLWAVEHLSQYEYYAQSEQLRNATAELLIANDFCDIYEFEECFECSVILARINNANGWGEYEEYIYEYNGILGIDVYFFEKLSPGSQKEALMELYKRSPYSSIDEFRNEFMHITSKLWQSSTVRPSGGGGSGASAGLSGIKCYVLTPSGEMIEEEPEENTKIKFVVQATLSVEPGVTYGVGVYGEQGELKCIKLFESKATQRMQHDFLEIETIYNPEDTVKIFTLDSENILKPLRQAFTTDMYYFGEELPSEEEETDGIAAYKGRIDSLSADVFTLNVGEIRSFGYWSNVVEKTDLDVEYSGYDVWFYDNFGDATYMIKNVDDKYVLDSIKTDINGEFLSFNGSDVVSASFTAVVVNIDGEEREYPVSPQAEFFINTQFAYSFGPDYFDYPDGLYTLMVDENGEIESVSLKYEEKHMEKISSVWADYLETESRMSIFIDDITLNGDIPDEGDIVEFIEYGDSLSVKVVEPVCATVCEEGVEIDGKVYEVDFYTSEQFVPGESCLAYFYTETECVGYIEKNFDNKELIIITRVVCDENNGVSIFTKDKTITLGEMVCLDGMIIKSEILLGIIEGVIPAYYEKGKDFDIIEPMEQTFNGSAKYIKMSDMMSPYFLKDSTKLFATNAEGGYEFDKSMLMDNNNYMVKVYSNDGIFADVIIFPDFIAQKTAVMVISKISVTEHEGEVCNEICGYVNGEELRLFDPYGRVGTVQIGDVLSVNYNPDYEVIRTSLVASFSQGYCMTGNLNNSYMIGDLYKISDDVISLIDREGQINLMRIALQGHLYIYYPEEEAVEVKSISELREIANPADYIIVNSAYGAVNFVVMEKYR